MPRPESRAGLPQDRRLTMPWRLRRRAAPSRRDCGAAILTAASGALMQSRRPVMLVILDGWGWREETADNAVRQAHTPTFDGLWSAGPRAFLRTSGREVGLP